MPQETLDQSNNAPLPSPEPQETSKTLTASTITGTAPEFQFSGDIPASWVAEAIPAIEAINIFDPQAPGGANIEKSQIFIRHFSGSDFLTLQTVTIHERETLTVASRPAVRYVIEKKAGVANFASQPLWRNLRHTVTDVRVSDANPSVFYVIAARPDGDAEAYARFLATLDVIAEPSGATLVEPIADMKARVTKKPFGIFITPETSPVQPERFRGYHTGIDVEYEDAMDDIPVVAIADGTVLTSRTASGYGGVVVIRHVLANETVLALYGHLDPSMLPSQGGIVAAGERIGVLGAGDTSETDGERKHLHFAILKDGAVDLRGYVQNQSELSLWYDPFTFF